MGTIGAGFSMSLDGFIAGHNDDMSRIFAWMFSGDTDVTFTRGDRDIDLKMSAESAERLEAPRHNLGALVFGRRMFDVAGAWGGKHPLDLPMFIITHNPPQEWVGKESPFTFVTDGLESALAQAKAVAGDKTIGVAGADITQQCLNAGLLDEIGIDLVPVLLGGGVRLFDHLNVSPVELECTSVTPARGVTHLTYRVCK
jgi:dihydrofolate reductase